MAVRKENDSRGTTMTPGFRAKIDDDLIEV
jgi:hypothetical protein